MRHAPLTPTRPSHRHRTASPRAAWAYSLVTLGALLAAGVATTAGAADPLPSVQEQRAYCQRATHEDRQACLREIGAARQEAQRGRLATGATESDYERNALRRCERLPAADRADCRSRIESGTTTGGVRQGGVLREYRQIIPAAPGAASTPAVPAAPAVAPSMPDPASGPASDAGGTPGVRS